ncbi:MULTISPECIES: hypothetical protein [Pseudocitrobacter]|nr:MULTISPECIES: hypothetical protein [Pseudocitrobacter]UYW73443.1 hypothetical protein OFY05_19050 [Pseudocitrobacter faecalis]
MPDGAGAYPAYNATHLVGPVSASATGHNNHLSETPRRAGGGG